MLYVGTLVLTAVTRLSCCFSKGRYVSGDHPFCFILHEVFLDGFDRVLMTVDCTLSFAVNLCTTASRCPYFWAFVDTLSLLLLCLLPFVWSCLMCLGSYIVGFFVKRNEDCSSHWISVNV